MAVPAPQCDTSDKSDAMYYIADAGAASADFNLTTIAGKPKWGPQKTTIWAATAIAIVLVDEAGVSFTITVPAGVPLVLTRPFKQITDSGTGAVSCIFEWFDPQGSNDWNR